MYSYMISKNYITSKNLNIYINKESLQQMVKISHEKVMEDFTEERSGPEQPRHHVPCDVIQIGSKFTSLEYCCQN